MGIFLTDEFERGSLPNVVSGVRFYGDADFDLWGYVDELNVNLLFIDHLCEAVLSRSRLNNIPQVPRIISRFWTQSHGFRFPFRGPAFSREEVLELTTAFVSVTPEELLSGIALVPAEECLRCAKTIQRFIAELLDSGSCVYIETYDDL